MKKIITLILIFLLFAMTAASLVEATEKEINANENYFNSENVFIWDVAEEIKPDNQVDFIIGYNVRESTLRTDYSYTCFNNLYTWRLFLQSFYFTGFPCELEIKMDAYGLYCEDETFKYRLCNSKGLVVQPNDFLTDGEYYYTERFHESFIQIMTPLGEETYSFEKGMMFKDWADSEYCYDSYHSDYELGIVTFIDDKLYILCDSNNVPVRRIAQIDEQEVYVLTLVENQKFTITRVVEVDEFNHDTLSLQYEYIKTMTFISWLSSEYCYPDLHGEPIIENGEIKFYCDDGVYVLYNSRMEKVKLNDIIQDEVYHLVFERYYL